jgi:VIT1/CCC1 family predicted Fe2+/Mn2+ transporter
MTSKILKAQKNEITEYQLYKKIGRTIKDKKNKEIIQQMAAQERGHYEMLKTITKQNVRPSFWQVHFYYYLARILGLSFALKLMEQGENLALKLYGELKNDYPQIAQVVKEEQEHEEKLLSLINSKTLDNVGSIILGLNDALVELTGALAGFTLALADTRLIAMVGFITGIAASISMAASSYLAAKEDPSKHAVTAGITTGISYVITVILLVGPFFIFANAFMALGVSLAVVIFIIFIFNFYISIARGLSFKHKFGEMALISLGAAAINFGIGHLVKIYFGV